MKKPSLSKHAEVEAGARCSKQPRGAVNVRFGPAKMTATLRRRALRKRPDKLAIVAQSVID